MFVLAMCSFVCELLFRSLLLFLFKHLFIHIHHSAHAQLLLTFLDYCKKYHLNA